MKALVIDTSSTAASVAVFNDQQLLGEVFINSKNTHSQKLMPIIEVLMSQTELKIKEIDAFYVCEGPGSFTGVRIGIATVKGFAQPFSKPIYGFTSMYLMACGYKHHTGLIVPIIDAKREDVYFGVYEWREGQVETLEEGVESLTSLLEYLKDKYPATEILLVGDAIVNYKDQLQANLACGGDASFILGNENELYAKASNYIFPESIEGQQTNVHTIRANYMRKSQAERDH